ncbi:MAG: hypothetical protein LBL79_02720 [Prevotella sp.]|jgi:hypothetical protein|nr:hypothetical protein [Prevotella sp.]
MYKIYLKISVIFCVALSLYSAGCKDIPHARSWGISVSNNSDKDVYFVLGFDIRDHSYYPITQLPNDSTRLWRAKPNQKIPLIYAPASAVKINLGDSIALFVFDPDTVAKYTWKQLGAGEKYLKKYGLKFDNRDPLYNKGI